MNINAQMVKALRDITGAGMMDCKKALVETNGDETKAIDYLREKGISKAEKKSARIAAEGLTNIFIDGNKAVIIEVNSETDFVAKNEDFKNLINIIGNAILKSNVVSLEEANKLMSDQENIETLIINATAKIGEKISFRRMEVVTKKDDETFGSYLHMGGKISSLVVISGPSEIVAKDIAMQAAAMRPKYISQNDVSSSVIEHEKEVLRVQALEEGKKEDFVDKIILGRLSKFFEEICLLDQTYFKDDTLKVKDYLKNNDSQVIHMVRYEVGEGMEKRCEDFAQEVKSQLS
ncbi:MAG: translation elongation factor Ts [Bacilli bacterium]